MKKNVQLLSVFLGMVLATVTHAANLVQVYQQAFISDPIFRQALFQRCSTKEGVPISLSALLPAAGIVNTNFISRAIASGSAVSTPTATEKGYDFTLTINQTIFDFSKIANLAGAISISRQADATINAAMQDLMLRVSKAYFAILNDEDNLRYAIANREAYAKQLEQVEQQYKVGIKTITDVHTARASYESSRALYISTLNQLQDDRENLRVITGVYYLNLAKLSEDFPMIMPTPNDMDLWVTRAECQNWSIMADRYATEAARQNIKQQFAGHLPTVVAQGIYDDNYTHFDLRNRFRPGFPPIEFNGSQQTHTKTANVIVNIPLVQGGLVVAKTRQAQYDYAVSVEQLQQTIRNTVNLTRQNFLDVGANISKIQADKQAIISNRSSLEGLRAQYDVGTATLIDVLLQQQRLFQTYTQYAADRYAYVNSLLGLKAAAGTLSVWDLATIGRWLIEDPEIYPEQIKTVPHRSICCGGYHHCANKVKVIVADPGKKLCLNHHKHKPINTKKLAKLHVKKLHSVTIAHANFKKAHHQVVLASAAKSSMKNNHKKMIKINEKG